MSRRECLKESSPTPLPAGAWVDPRREGRAQSAPRLVPRRRGLGLDPPHATRLLIEPAIV